jgi:hypothetical protein
LAPCDSSRAATAKRLRATWPLSTALILIDYIERMF